ncbi:MAG: DUF202 domain-containing protein [Actinomycetota bacterium]
MRTRPSWLAEGADPDYRFSLANERTFLAWIRTALSLLAGAVAVVQLVPEFRLSGARVLLGAILAAAGLLLSVLAYPRWSANERAMRRAAPLPYSPVLLVVTGAIALVGAVVLVLVVFTRW